MDWITKHSPQCSMSQIFEKGLWNISLWEGSKKTDIAVAPMKITNRVSKISLFSVNLKKRSTIFVTCSYDLRKSGCICHKKQFSSFKKGNMCCIFWTGYQNFAGIIFPKNSFEYMCLCCITLDDHNISSTGNFKSKYFCNPQWMENANFLFESSKR